MFSFTLEMKNSMHYLSIGFQIISKSYDYKQGYIGNNCNFWIINLHLMIHANISIFYVFYLWIALYSNSPS